MEPPILKTRPPVHNRAIPFWVFLSAAAWTGALSAIAFFTLPYPVLKVIADRLSRDWNARPFTPFLYASLRPWAGLATLLFLGAVIFLWVRRPAVLAGLDRAQEWFWLRLRRLAADTVLFFRQVRAARPARGELFLLLALTLIAAWLRLVAINHAMGYDEAYTYLAFASQPAWKLLSDYHLPNNHVFHTLLVHIATLLVGSNQPWAVRIPTFAAGVLAVPAIYLLARRLYDRTTAIISACLVASAPFLIRFSVDARGYMLLTLLSVLAFWAGAYLLRQKNRFVWTGLVVLNALGFFTIPIMLYPFGSLMVWLLASALAGDLGDGYRSKWDFLRYWLAAGLATGLLTLLLYAPILVVSGPRALFANQFVSSIPWDQFLARMRSGWTGTWNDWFSDFPVYVKTAAALAFAASLLLYRRISRYKVPTQAAVFAWIAFALLVQRTDTFSKIWVFLEVFFLMWCAFGLTALLSLVPFGAAQHRARLQGQAANLLAAAAVAALCLFPLRQSLAQPLQIALDHGDARSSMQHLRAVIQPGDMIVVDIPVDAPIQYYAMVEGIPQRYFYLPKQGDRPFNRAFLVVAPQFEQTPTSVLEHRYLDPTKFDLANRRTESDFGIYRVYRVLPTSAGQ